MDDTTAPAMATGSETPLSVVVLNRDLMFGVQIGNVLRALGFAPTFVRSTELLRDAALKGGDAVALAILDMNGPIEWSIVEGMGGDPACPPILAFGPHVDVAGRRAAKAAGVTRLVSNGEFHQGMVALIERYARRTGEPPAG